MKKSDASDAMLLSRISKEAFGLLMIEELEIEMQMRPLIRKYERMVRLEKTLKKLISQGFDYSFKEAVRLIDSERQRISRSIIRQVSNLPIYGEFTEKSAKFSGSKRALN